MASKPNFSVASKYLWEKRVSARNNTNVKTVTNHTPQHNPPPPLPPSHLPFGRGGPLSSVDGTGAEEIRGIDGALGLFGGLLCPVFGGLCRFGRGNGFPHKGVHASSTHCAVFLVWKWKSFHAQFNLNAHTSKDNELLIAAQFSQYKVWAPYLSQKNNRFDHQSSTKIVSMNTTGERINWCFKTYAFFFIQSKILWFIIDRPTSLPLGMSYTLPRRLADTDLVRVVCFRFRNAWTGSRR